MKLPAHEATTAQLGAVYPFAATRRLPTDAVLVGRDLLGGLFVHDPFELYTSGFLTNPNMLVLGQIGRGKSAFVKSYLYRQAVFGRRIVILDPKGEYGPLARALGTEPIVLRPDGDVRLNPLDLIDRQTRGSASHAELALVCELACACLGRPLQPGEHVAIELAIDSERTQAALTLASIAASLLEPRAEAARKIGSTASELRNDGRDVGLELRRFVSGELAGMFDGETSTVSLAGPVVVIDLSEIYHSAALGAVVTCVPAALHGSWKRAESTQSFLVIDEGWAVLQNPGAARFLQASFKLARARGVANLVVVHRASDLSASGPDGSITQRIAEGLLADCETIVCYAQAESEIEGAGRLFGLSEQEERLLSRLRRGVALWRIGNRSFLVEHRLAPKERALVDTD